MFACFQKLLRTRYLRERRRIACVKLLQTMQYIRDKEMSDFKIEAECSLCHNLVYLVSGGYFGLKTWHSCRRFESSWIAASSKHLNDVCGDVVCKNHQHLISNVTIIILTQINISK